MKYTGCWITLNRICNLKCKWCYAKETNYEKKDDMSLENVYKIIDICNDLHLRHISLIGGEPSLYPHLKEVIAYAKGKNITCGLITNGITLSDEKFLQELKNVGLKSISISLKGENIEVYKNITQRNFFNKVMQAISNCSKIEIPFSVSMVLTEENIETFINGVKEAKKYGANRFYFSFCYEFNVSSEYNDYLKKHNIKTIAKKFQNIYPILNDITEGKFKLFQSYPMCVWNSEFIEKLAKNKQISSVCQLLKRSGLIFDSQCNLIPCNAMYNLKLGQLGNNFNNAEELLEYVNSKDVVNIYNKLCGLPSEDCLLCKDQSMCGGGCVCQWTNFNFNDLRNLKE